MADQRPGSYAHSIDPEGSIKGPDLSAAFDRGLERPVKTADAPVVPLFSSQVANTNLSPREPAPIAGYDQAKAAQHIASMKADDQAAQNPALIAKTKLFAEQNAARKAKGAPSLGKSFGKGMERGDD